jgi:nitrogen fixation protein FixH
MTVRSRDVAARRSGWIPWMFVAGFGVILAANGALVHYALSSRVALVDDAPYERGLAMERLVEEADHEAALGWTLRVAPERLDGDRAAITLDLADRDGPIPDASVVVRLTRPIEGDATEPLEARVAGGRAVLDVEGLRPGQWEIAVTARRDGHTVRFFRRVVLA